VFQLVVELAIRGDVFILCRIIPLQMKSPHVLNRSYCILFISLLFLFVCGSIATAQAPDLTAGGVPNNSERFNIGPTGLRGWAYQDGNNKTPDSRQILVTEVSAGSPADGMMAVRIKLVQNEQLCCTAKVSFMMADSTRMEELLPNGVPDGWHRFFDGPDAPEPATEA